MKLDKPLLVSQAALLVNAEFLGEKDIEITGINEIHMVEEGDVTFVDHPKYYDKVLKSKATTIIINKKVEVPEGKALLYTEDPFAAYVKLVNNFVKFEPANQAVSPTAKIGKGTIIQPGAFIGNNVTIGEDCVIHSNACIYDGSVIGSRVIIHANSVIGADAYYFQRRPEGYRKLVSCGRVVISDDVEIGALCSIDKGVSGDTFIGKGTKFDNHVQVGHDTSIGQNCLIGAHSAIAGVTKIEDDVLIWGRVVVNKDLVVGKGAVILATSAVDKSIEGGKTYFGAPAGEVRKVWREQAALRMLPEILAELRKKE
ncbi:UDP-3-O-(3-hydroxymyristoyl)glucosamine N-acyltransferase [Bacteroidales bacterium OttesenSCG-928-C19]|nr:UDP-3-O-(3-hydroxymyristoyl)glucosamine N-acyltransferase [Bacteroidales bacterium OttesenSCG-928-C19]